MRMLHVLHSPITDSIQAERDTTGIEFTSQVTLAG